jgi:hypothetical protein
LPSAIAFTYVVIAGRRLWQTSGSSALKKRAGTESADIYEYGAAKSAMVQRILLAAGLSEEERESIGANEVPVTERKR